MPATAIEASVKDVIQAELKHIVALRHDLHRHPELQFEEKRTARTVAEHLRGLGLEVKTDLCKGTGVIAYLPATDDAGNNRPAVALRADMDALPIVEATGRPYASTTPGVMHACGHDGHTAILVGVARAMVRLTHRPNPVLFLFQPAEEGGGGADIMCRQGVLEGGQSRLKPGGLGNPVGRIFGLHGWPSIALGRIATRPGPLMASVDDFVVTVRGTQAHGAYPHQGHDPILAAAHCVTALQQIASRNVGPLESVVVTVGRIQGGTANNIIPQEVSFIGTVRTLTPDTRRLARGRFCEIVEHTARACGCTAGIDYLENFPVTVNDAGLTEHFFDIARATLGSSSVDVLEQPTMGGEDFSFYGSHVPACFFYLGLKPGNAERYPGLHQPDFDFNDAAIPTGVRLMIALATAEWDGPAPGVPEAKPARRKK
jgi:hippurate hydrolase